MKRAMSRRITSKVEKTVMNIFDFMLLLLQFLLLNAFTSIIEDYIMSRIRYNPNFGEVYCPYVALRIYDNESESRQVSIKKSKVRQRTTHKLPSIIKNSRFLTGRQLNV